MDRKAHSGNVIAFWGSLSVAFLFWLAIFIVNIFSLSLFWVGLGLFCAKLHAINLICFYKCKG